MLRLIAIFLSIAGLAAAQQPVSHGRRLAIVIANADYEKLPKLTSPMQEARLMISALTAAGFVVQNVENTKFQDVIHSANTFFNSVQAGDTVVFYYSGYAVQGDDDNYLLPVDFKPQSGDDLEKRSYHLNLAQQRLDDQKAALKIFILETGRPINERIAGVSAQGLMEPPETSPDSLFAFAWPYGKTAPQNDSGAGLFTQQVARYMNQPGVRVSELFNDAKREVAGLTNESQVPEVRDNILHRDFFFKNPAMVVSQNSLSFDSQSDAAPAPKFLNVSAGGYAGNFAVSVPDGAAWVSATPSGVTPASVSVEVRPTTLVTGSYATNLVISAVDGDMTPSPQRVAVSYTVSAVHRTGPVPRNPKDREEYILLPRGRFKMGCVPSDKKCDKNEYPQHTITISRDFWMGVNEVEVDAYKLFIAAKTSKQVKMPKAPPRWDWNQGNLPMVLVSWQNAHDYCAWAGGRLPTEAEWEYAARGGADDQISPLNIDNARDKANFHGQQGNDIYEFTAPVRKFDANGFGLYDMAGNVWEWVSDFFSPDYYAHSPAVNPTVPAEGKPHVIRGGSWDSDIDRYLRTSLRKEWSQPWASVGFRCVLDDTPQTHKSLGVQ